GVATPYDLSFTDPTTLIQHPVKTEDLDPIIAGNAFFGSNFGNNRILTAANTDFAPFIGSVLLTQEFPCGSASANRDAACLEPGSQPAVPGTRTSGLYVVQWVGAGGNAAGGAFRVTPLKPTAGSVNNVDQWEHVTMAPLGPPVLQVSKTPDNGVFTQG